MTYERIEALLRKLGYSECAIPATAEAIAREYAEHQEFLRTDAQNYPVTYKNAHLREG